MMVDVVPVKDGWKGTGPWKMASEGFRSSGGSTKPSSFPGKDHLDKKYGVCAQWLFAEDASGMTDFHITYELPLVVELEEGDKVIYIGDIFHSFLRKNELGQIDTEVDIRDSFLT